MPLAASWRRCATSVVVAVVLAACGAEPNDSQSVGPSAASDGSPSPDASTSQSPPLVDVGPVVCESERLGIVIEVPDGWFHTRSGPSACQFLNPDPFDMAGPEPTGRVAIEVRLIEGDVGTTDQILSREDLQVDGKSAVRWELRTGDGDVFPAGTLITQYVVQLGPLPEAGPNLLVQTTSVSAPYEGNRDTLDEMMTAMKLPGW